MCSEKESHVSYIFLVVAVVWAVQLGLAYWQLQRFHRRIAELRRYGRTSVGMSGNRWRGRTYGVLAVDPEGTIRRAEVFAGVTIFSQLRPVSALEGRPLSAVAADSPPPAGVPASQWAAFTQAAQFLRSAPAGQAQLA
jgi:DNA-binding transcriptional regulator of glucitol operon